MQRRNTLRIVPPRKLTNNTLLLIILEPLSRSLESLFENRGTDACSRSTRAIGIEILVHLVYQFVLWVFQINHTGAVAGGNPRPCASPAVALRGDVLFCGACGADAVDGGLVEVEDELLVHVMVFVVCVEDDEVVVFVFGGDVGPPGFEGGCVGYDVAEEAAVVVRLDHGVGAFGGYVVYLLGKVAEVKGVEGAG